MSIDSFLECMKIMNQHLIINILIIIFLMIASYFDLKHKKIPNKLNLSFFIIRILLIPIISINTSNILGLLIGFFAIFIPAFIVNKPMGGDIKAMTVLGFYLGKHNIVILLFLIVIISFICFTTINYLFKEKKEIPFAPFFLAAYIFLCLVTNFI